MYPRRPRTQTAARSPPGPSLRPLHQQEHHLGHKRLRRPRPRLPSIQIMDGLPFFIKSKPRHKRHYQSRRKYGIIYGVMAELAVLEKCEVCTTPTLTRREFCTTAAAVVSTAALSPFVVNARETKAKPFVKWAGGKGQLLERLAKLLPRDLATRKDFTYIEPFVGGGAMLFYMLSTFPNISRVIINDFNHDLIQCYTAIRNTPDDLIRELEKHQSAYYALKDEDARKTYYLSQRAA